MADRIQVSKTINGKDLKIADIELTKKSVDISFKIGSTVLDVAHVVDTYRNQFPNREIRMRKTPSNAALKTNKL